MRVATAMLPDASSSQDRIFTTENAVIVLDGASAFVPVEVSPSTFVDTLGGYLVGGLAADPRIPLTDLLAQAIKGAALVLGLRPGASPSSTVAIAREDEDGLDLPILGDSQIATPQGIHLDDRIANCAQPQRAEYRARLAAGDGYNKTHRELLKALQAEQKRHRNADGGYWIAEAHPGAANHAITMRLSIKAVPWLVIATDGAYRPMHHLNLDNWAAVAGLDSAGLQSLLNTLDRWERYDDSDGTKLPRAKRHDDKALAAVRLR